MILFLRFYYGGITPTQPSPIKGPIKGEGSLC